MLSSDEAIVKLKAFIPDCDPLKVVTFNGLYIFLAPRTSDLDEGYYDPYFSVDMNTGEAKGYSLFQDGKAKEIASLFENAPYIERI